jgi:hypothetical protein
MGYAKQPERKVYLEAYRADGTQILGNMDGQAVIRARRYERTLAYKNAVLRVANYHQRGGRVASYKVVDEAGRLLEVIR